MPTRQFSRGTLYTDARIRAVQLFLRQNIQHRLTLEEAASLANLEKHYFSTYFHQRVGTTFSRWQQKYRVDCAKTMLVNSDLHVSRISERVGYDDLSSFERLFRRHVGISPRQYRASQSLNRN